MSSASLIGGIVAIVAAMSRRELRSQPELAVSSASLIGGIVAIVAAMSALVASFALSRSRP